MRRRAGASFASTTGGICYVLDRHAMKLFKPVIDRTALEIKNRGYSADQVTFTGFGLGLFTALCIVFGFYQFAILPMLASRALDGLDGAVARAGIATDRGAFLDIGLDFVFYASIPLAFGLANPDSNALAAATLLAAFVGTGASFLAYAIIAEKRGLKSAEYPTKSFYYLGGLAEGTETIACFLAMCLWPQHFAVLAYLYAALCLITTITRLLAGWNAFAGSKD
jgi:phosphatidylglycerophosphate synthase